MGSILTTLLYILFILFILFFSFTGIIVYFQLFDHLKKYHTEKLDTITYKTFLGIPSDYLWAPPIKPITFLKFMISSDCFNDEAVRKYKNRIRIHSVIFISLPFWAPLLIP